MIFSSEELLYAKCCNEFILFVASGAIEEYSHHSELILIGSALVDKVKLYIIKVPVKGVLSWSVEMELKEIVLAETVVWLHEGQDSVV